MKVSVSVSAIVLLATGIPAGAVTTTAASATTTTASTSTPAAPDANATICNRYCDGRDPALSPVDRSPVSTTTFARRLILHFADTDAMGWASIDTGSPADEFWLDPSFDGGRSWASGSKLG